MTSQALIDKLSMKMKSNHFSSLNEHFKTAFKSHQKELDESNYADDQIVVLKHIRQMQQKILEVMTLRMDEYLINQNFKFKTGPNWTSIFQEVFNEVKGDQFAMLNHISLLNDQNNHLVRDRNLVNNKLPPLVEKIAKLED